MSVSLTTRIYVVRHGTTDWNQHGRLQGLVDTRLNADGMRDVHRLVHRFRSTPVSVAIASPLSRARTTASLVSRRLTIPLETDARLCEVDHGVWTGLTIAEISRRHPDAVYGGHLRGDAPLVARAESLVSVYRRASSFLVDILHTYMGQSLLVVGHGVTNALLFVAAAGADIAMGVRPTANAGGIVMTFRGQHLVDCRSIDVEGHP